MLRSIHKGFGILYFDTKAGIFGVHPHRGFTAPYRLGLGPGLRLNGLKPAELKNLGQKSL